MSDCCLCELKGSFLRVTICKTCGVPMLVHEKHQAEFTEMEKKLIEAIFPPEWFHIRWKMRKIHDHAHCHVYPIQEPGKVFVSSNKQDKVYVKR